MCVRLQYHRCARGIGLLEGCEIWNKGASACSGAVGTRYEPEETGVKVLWRGRVTSAGPVIPVCSDTDGSIRVGRDASDRHGMDH